MKTLVTVIAVLGLSLSAAHAQEAQPEEQLPYLTGQEYAEVEENKPDPVARTEEDKDNVYVMLVGFKECMPCNLAERLVFYPLMKLFLQEQYVKIVKVDIQEDAKQSEAAKRIANLFNVEKFPTLLVVHRNEEKYRHVGFSVHQKEQVKQKISEVITKLKTLK